MSEERDRRIGERLAGATLLVTGASGFVTKAVLARCLADVPELGEIRVLLRAPDDEAATARLRDEVLSSRAFDELDPDDAPEALRSGRLTALAGDVERPGLGRDGLDALAGVDVVVHGAASVSFEQPLDEMLELNALGPRNLVRALRDAGARPHVVHVSTAYAAGMRTGLVLERPSGRSPAEPDVDLEAELAVARAWRAAVEVESRLPEHQHRFAGDARQELGPAGALAVGARAEQLRRAWVVDRLVERGRERSRALGWPDAYGLSKALGERLLVAEDLRSLTIVRPTIVESALRRPYPGWIEGLKVADPVILAYARGMIRRFPLNPSARMDVIPVDLVANACVAAAAHAPASGCRVLTVATGTRNPLLIGEMAQHITDYFHERPLPDDDDLPVEVQSWRFDSHRRVLRALDGGHRTIHSARRVLDRVAVPRADDAERRLHREQRRLERLRRLADIYGPYGELDCLFDDRHTSELLASLHPDDRERFDFGVEAIDWPTYIKEVHLPALRELVRPPARPPRVARGAGTGLAPGQPGLAIFDVEGVVLDATVAHFYAWLRGRGMPSLDRTVWLATLATRAPGWLLADRRSRSAFNRAFYREYRGLPARELREQAQAALSDFILPRVCHAAVRRIRAHRARGDRVVLVTGALDFLVEPLGHLADELVAARLLERRGAFTGELAEPPLSADGRASLAARLAAEHDVDLGDCHAYGDSISDLPLLELVGHPSAVNPDFRLAREARRRGWPILRWRTEPGARTRPAAPVEVPA
jgi:alcohol-forming fatty acyl-CoA reductase